MPDDPNIQITFIFFVFPLIVNTFTVLFFDLLLKKKSLELEPLRGRDSRIFEKHFFTNTE